MRCVSYVHQDLLMGYLYIRNIIPAGVILLSLADMAYRDGPMRHFSHLL